jgi:hypothetical protein
MEVYPSKPANQWPDDIIDDFLDCHTKENGLGKRENARQSAVGFGGEKAHKTQTHKTQTHKTQTHKTLSERAREREKVCEREERNK